MTKNGQKINNNKGNCIKNIAKCYLEGISIKVKNRRNLVKIFKHKKKIKRQKMGNNGQKWTKINYNYNKLMNKNGLKWHLKKIAI